MEKKPISEHKLSLSEKVKILKTVSIFSTTNDITLADIAELLTELWLNAGVTIFEQGEEGTSLYIIVMGSVKIFDPQNNYTFAELGEGKVFGEYALLDTEKRSASVATIQNTFLLSLEQESFFDLMNTNNQILTGILKELVRRSRVSNQLQESLAQKQEELSKSNQQLNKFNRKLNATNEALLNSKKLIEAKNKSIEDSINYARNIQRALLPLKAKFDRLLTESFVFFKPRDIVSGDFYWIASKKDKVFVAAVDCTGHGVPGAFMSLLGINFLNQIVRQKDILDACEILCALNNAIQDVLNQKNGENHDGMDMTLCVIDKQAKSLVFSGAKNPLYYIHEGNFQTIKGGIFPIGGIYMAEVEKIYVEHTIQLQQNTMFYIFSDGFQDQFGGKKDKKYSVKRFKELLLEIHEKEMQAQHDALANAFEAWKRSDTYEQTDDVLVIGFRL